MTDRTLTTMSFAAVLALASGCLVELDRVDRSTDRAPIVGGTLENGFPLVGMLAADAWGEIYPFCTATAVTPTVVITAAHCTDTFVDPRLEGAPIIFQRLAPDGSGPTHGVEVASRRNHPRWATALPGAVNDIGLARLTNPIDASLFPEQHRTRPDGSIVGTFVTAVGFGVSEPGSTPEEGEGAGTKRSIEMPISGVSGEYFILEHSESWRGVCYGDSGGPSFYIGEHRNVQVGIHARTRVEACGPGEDTTVGFYYESFVAPTVLSLDGSADQCGDGLCTGIEIESECPEDCSPFECGDGVTEGPEACDDGNVAGGDGCSADCSSDESCGNGIADSLVGEACDDGNVVGGDGCSGDCSSDESCGNAIVDDLAGEVCDDGNSVGGDGCSDDCASDESCGNDIVDLAAGEQCDDGNSVGGDGCSGDCASDESCGNGIIDDLVGEVCDDGNALSGDGCSSDCRIAEGCGDGVVNVDFGEVCDDGNLVGGDGCSANCRSDETCGNAIVDDEVGEACDDGNADDDDLCPGDCGAPAGSLPGLSGGCACHVSLRPAAARRLLVALFL